MALRTAAQRGGGGSGRRFFHLYGSPPPFCPQKVAEAVAKVAAASASPPLLPPAKPSPNVFVTGLSDHTNSQKLKRVFGRHGKIHHAEVMTDYWHERSLGFGFVRYATLEEAAKAIKAMDGKELDASKISVEFARPRLSSELRSSVVPWKWTNYGLLDDES